MKFHSQNPGGGLNDRKKQSISLARNGALKPMVMLNQKKPKTAMKKVNNKSGNHKAIIDNITCNSQ